MRRMFGIALAALVAVSALLPGGALASGGERKLFVTSGIEDRVRNEVSLPLYEGRTATGQSTWYVVLDASTKTAAERMGVNYVPKLSNARGTTAIQTASLVGGTIIFPATVDFSPTRVVQPGPTGFPPAAAAPGAIGEAGYSPLIQLPDGTILNAPQVANASGLHDKLVSISADHSRAVFRETEGFYNGKEVYYVSFDATDPGVAALEASTYAPALNAAPGIGSNDKKTSSRSGIAPFVNGQTGVNNPNRQGLNSALLDGLDPLNVVQSSPHNAKYSPLWDAHVSAWTDAAIAAGLNTRQMKFEDIAKLAEQGLVTGPGGGAWGAVGIIINCPVISQE